ncbi:MAG: FecR family protein [Pirellulaceae bacterium]
MTDDAQRDLQRTIADALEDSLDGPLEPRRLASIRALLETSPAARRYYLEANELTHALSFEKPQAPSREALSSTTAGSRWLPIASAALVAAMMLVAVGVFQFGRDQRLAASPAIATIHQFQGQGTVTSADAAIRNLADNLEIRSGDTIRTQGAVSSAVLAYRDGSRVSLVSDSSLTTTDDGQKSVVLHGGTMFASIVPQPNGRPLIVATPQDRVQAPGADFSLDATAGRTDMSVRQGRLRLTRLSDGQSVEVPAGRRVVSSAAAPLVVAEIPETPPQWSEDFEAGLPARWHQGRLVADALPPGSRGAVKAVEVESDQGRRSQIVSQEAWTHGLFAAHRDSHLHFTLKMQQSGWFNILILTKTADGDSPAFAGNYIFDQPVWFDRRPGAWGTVTIPLSKFRPLPPSPDAIESVVPIQILFSSPDQDRGLVIDRVWVTRGGPGEIEVEPSPEDGAPTP